MGDKAPKTERCVCGSWFIVDAYPDGHICYPAQATKALRKQLAIAVGVLKLVVKQYEDMSDGDIREHWHSVATNALKQIEELSK